METISLRVANWNEGEVQKVCYSTSIKVPRKQELLSVLPNHLQYNLKFVTGILGGVEHHITLCIFRDNNEPRIGVFVTIGKHPEKVVSVTIIDSNYVALDQANMEYSLSRCVQPQWLDTPAEHIGVNGDGGNPAGNTEFWGSTYGWHDETAMIFLTFHVVSREPPKIVNEEVESLLVETTNSSTGKINTAGFFLCEQYSDISVHCQSQKFPAHRLILARIPYFDSMLSAQMSESVEGIINITDMSPDTCKELLRFIYQGKLEQLSASPVECITELYAVADKYGISELKGICEQYFYQNLTCENALEIFDLSQMHGSPVLAKRSKDLIISNKAKFIPDAETLKAFTIKYPDLVFQILNIP